MYSPSNKSLHLGVFAPYLQGDYMGEIVNQLRHICGLKNYRFSALRTDGFGQYSLPLGLDTLDGVIVIRNAVNPKLVEKIQNRGIPVIAIAHDYFPLDIPVVASDNSRGAELAFNYLRDRGHQNLMFVGDITQYDLRKRYERFQDLLRAHGFPSTKDQLIVAPDTIFSGGLAAGSEFLQRKSNCTGVFCGAGHTAMGFIKKLEESGLSFPGEIDVLAFDAIRLMKVLTPDLAYIDQNLDVLAERCITALENMIYCNTMPHAPITVDPTLCPPSRDNEESDAKAGQWEVFSDADYMGSLLNNSFEMTRDIVKARLDLIMSAAPLFSEFMDVGVLSHMIIDDRRMKMHARKVFEHTKTYISDVSDKDYVCAPEEFPPKAVRERLHAFDSGVHFPIFVNNRLWGALSFYGFREKAHYRSCFSSFTHFMDNVTFGYSLLLENSELRDKLKQSEIDASPHIKHQLHHESNLPSFEWDLEKGSVRWSDIALELLGFTTELEKNIYRNMEIFDRVHPDDEQKLRKDITNSLVDLKAMTTAARLKNAEGDFRHYSLQGEILREEDSRAIHYRCCLSLIN